MVKAPLTRRAVGLRAQEFHEGLKELSTFGPKEAHLRATTLVGKTACLASHLRGLDYAHNLTALTYLAAELGISSVELTPVLRELEELDFASIVRAGEQIKRIERRIPELRDGYEDLGERWFTLQPSEIEHASLYLLDRVADFPSEEHAMQQELGLSSRDFGTVLILGATDAIADTAQGS